MVESNHAEERLARIEQMIEALQREAAALKMITDRLAISAANQVRVVTLERVITLVPERDRRAYNR
jgi:hypothetical protein